MDSSWLLRCLRWAGVKDTWGRVCVDEEPDAKPESTDALSLNFVSGTGFSRGDVDWEDVSVRSAESMLRMGAWGVEDGTAEWLVLTSRGVWVCVLLLIARGMTQEAMGLGWIGDWEGYIRRMKEKEGEARARWNSLHFWTLRL
jgi:hypothetical protein